MTDRTNSRKLLLISKVPELGKWGSAIGKTLNEWLPSGWHTNHNLVSEKAWKFIMVIPNAVHYIVEVDVNWPLVFECNLMQIWKFLVSSDLQTHQQRGDSRLLGTISSICCNQTFAWWRWKQISIFIWTGWWPVRFWGHLMPYSMSWMIENVEKIYLCCGGARLLNRSRLQFIIRLSLFLVAS